MSLTWETAVAAAPEGSSVLLALESRQPDHAPAARPSANSFKTCKAIGKTDDV
jgi:hypothetical protein